MFDTPFVVLLIVAGTCVGFLNAAGKIVKEGSRLESLVSFIESFKTIFGISALVIALMNALNVWANDYALLSWIIVLTNSLILLDQFLQERLNISEGAVLTALQFLETHKVILGISCLIIVLLKTIILLAPLLSAIL